jgi:hypothetical protein
VLQLNRLPLRLLILGLFLQEVQFHQKEEMFTLLLQLMLLQH